MTKTIKEITPDPIVTSTVEIRFSSDLGEHDVLNTFYKLFGQRFPKVTDRGYPHQIKKANPDLIYTPDYILSNDEYSISISNKVIAFENIGRYKLWDNYFNMIVEALNVLAKDGLVKGIKRVGVRYASILKPIDGLISVVRTDFLIGYKNYTQTNNFFRTLLSNEKNVKMNVQIVENASVKRGTEERSGVYIDIDVFQEMGLPQVIESELFTVIDGLHSEEKDLFEFLVKKSYLDTLQVEYK